MVLFVVVIPLVSIVIFSFWTSTGHGLQPGFQLQNYAEYFVSDGFFDPESRRFLSPSVFVKTLGSTFRFTFEVMLLCLLIGYPIAYFLAMRVNSFKWQMAYDEAGGGEAGAGRRAGGVERRGEGTERAARERQQEGDNGSTAAAQRHTMTNSSTAGAVVAVVLWQMLISTTISQTPGGSGRGMTRHADV